MKDTSLIGNFYANSVQLEDNLTSPSTLTTKSYFLFPVHGELSDLDGSFSNFKTLPSLLSKFSTISIGTFHFEPIPRSYISVFNSFRSDYEDFQWHRFSFENKKMSAVSLVLNSSETAFTELFDLKFFSNFNENLVHGTDLRLSNTATLRPSIRNSVVNYNAFQKVFKPRLDEGRAHTQSSNFADTRLRQPFLMDLKVPYLQLLGKNRDNFFETPLHKNLVHKNLNLSSSFMNSVNSPMYDFPFLLARTSDVARFT